MEFEIFKSSITTSSRVDQLDAGCRPHVQSIVQLTVILTNVISRPH